MRRFKTQSNLTRAALTLLIALLSTATAWAYNIPDTGSCGPNATYTINDSTMTISGTGEISNYVFTSKDFSGIKSIVINEGLTDIGNNAFSTNMSPDLTLVNLPASLININRYAFEQCAALTTVNIAPNSQLQTIGWCAFGDTGLTSIDLSGCHGLTSIAYGAFYESPLGGAVDLSGCTSLSSIGEFAFFKTSITSMSLPASLISLGQSAFDECTALSTVTIADGSLLTTIGTQAFQQCNFESIVLPCAGLTRIDNYAFNRYSGLQNLTEIICLTEDSLSVDGAFYNNCNQVTVYMYTSKKVDWQDAKAVKGLFTITPDESITDINGKIYGDYYAEGSEITISTNQTAYGFEVNGVSVDAVSLGNNQYQLTLPNNITTDNVTLRIASIYSITVPNFAHGSVASDMATALEGTTVTLTATPDDGYELESFTVMNGDTPVETTAGANGTYTFVMPAGDVTVNAIFTSLLGEGDGSEGNPYIISSAEGWDYFCDCLQDNDTWNRFSGKTVKLGADISITRSAGSSGHEFMGTFDGDYHTLTVNITATTTQGTAPFREIRGATIRKLITTGSVNGTLHAAGLVGFARGDASVTNTIEHCKVAANVTVTTAINGNYHCGGVVGHALNSTLNIRNTVYCGAISNSGNYVGGIQGWSDGNTVNLSNCLFTGSYEGYGVFHPIAVRYMNTATTATVNNTFYSATPTLTDAQYIAANGTKTVGVTDIPATLGSEVDTTNFMTVYEGGIFFDGLYYASPVLSTDSDGAFVINNASEWEYFCENLQDNDTWNRFSGKTVKLGADISVTRMAGSATHDFCGTFDGNHKTITFNYGSEAEPESGISALFSHTSSTKPFGVDTISPATIKDLTVGGTIWTSSSDAAGFVGRIYGTLNLTGCTSNIAINSTADFPAGFINYSDQTSTVNISGCTSNATINTTASYAAGHVGHLYGSVNIEHSISNAEITAAGGAGGFVGLCEHTVNFSDCLSDAVIHSSSGNNSGFVGWSRASGHAISFTGCVFNGKLLQIDSIGNSNGGFIGWTGSNKTVTITDCLVDPAALAQGETMASGNSATFARGWNATTTATNCYFTDTLGVVQGKQAHSIIAGQGVTVEMANSATEYETSGITAYGTGIMYKGVLYAGVNDEVSLNLDGSDDGYSVNAGTLTGEENPFTLLMPDERVTITAAAQFQRGDVNHDGHITISDMTALIDYLLSNDSAIPAEADVNADSAASIADVTVLIDYLLGGAI